LGFPDSPHTLNNPSTLLRRLEVIAEGVETKEQLHTLRGLDCDQVQGFLFSKPVDAAAAEQLYRTTCESGVISSPTGIPLPLDSEGRRQMHVVTFNPPPKPDEKPKETDALQDPLGRLVS